MSDLRGPHTPSGVDQGWTVSDPLKGLCGAGGVGARKPENVQWVWCVLPSTGWRAALVSLTPG